ncbi:hypothetical protein CMU14_13240 [Elizabethkingia anophelis]|nr:hypothetical protein [Elizabethkingia anophelis]
MENTLKNKAAFMAQYWGQKVFKYNREGSPISPEEVGNVLFIPKSKAIDYSYLELKPLSAITDDDVIELLRFKEGRDFERYDENVIKWARKQIDNLISIETIDFIRSKGYALPWMGLSVEKLVEYGWIKLKNKES